MKVISLQFSARMNSIHSQWIQRIPSVRVVLITAVLRLLHSPTEQSSYQVATFSNGTKFVSGNRCERGEDLALDREPANAKEKLPNLFDYKYSRTFSYYKPLKLEDAPRGEIGIPRVLNQYENYPFWFTVLTKLGFRVLISARSSHKIYEGGMETIPSESVCYPAKLAHGHIENLIERGIKTIFYPDVPYENIENSNSNNHYNCPIVCSYPEVIRNNVENLLEKNIRYLNPFMPLDNLDNVALHLTECFDYLGVSAEEAKQRALRVSFLPEDHITVILRSTMVFRR